MTCNNCSNTFDAAYCGVCGQKAGVGRLTLHSLWHEVWHGFTHTDKGVVRLCTDLLLRPAAAYHNYFRGKRKSYFSPVVFFLLSFGLYIYCDLKVFDYQDHVTLLRSGQAFNNEIGRLVQEHLKYIALTLLPFQSLLTLAFFYRRANLAEAIVFWLFCVGFINTLMILLTPVRLLLIDNKGLIEFILSLLIMLIYFIHLLAAFGKGFINIIKAAAVVFLVSILNTYIGLAFLGNYIDMPSVTFSQAVKITFNNSSVVYRHGKTTIE